MTDHLPNFLIAGAAKSGTTSLYYYLKGHPEIFFPTPKEPCFFSAQAMSFPLKYINTPYHYTRSFDEYKSLYSNVHSQKAIGDASIDTMYYYQTTIPLIKKTLGNPKIIIMLRNPVNHVFSMYNHMFVNNLENLTFEDALTAEVDRIKDDWEPRYHYKAKAMYFEQVNAFVNSFDNIRVYLYEEFIKEPGRVVDNIINFLGVSDNYQPPNLNIEVQCIRNSPL